MKRYYIPLLSALISTEILDALPGGLQVASGRADLNLSSPEAIEILVDHQSILNWQEFSIEANEKVTFIQPNSSSCVLNRVLGGNPSQIFGVLQANGKVLLLNHRGVLFGKDAQVDVGSLIASTLDLNDEVFLRGEALLFEGGSDGSVENLGTIRTADGDLLLISKEIEHSGFAEAQNGSLGLIGTRKVIVQPDPNQPILIKTSLSALNRETSSFSAAFTHEENVDALLFDG